MEKLVQKFYEKYASVQTEIVRDFIDEIDWSNRVIGNARTFVQGIFALPNQSQISNSQP
ncbi:MAG TPA: hypothetical protein VIK10_02365 [Prolixibacteraceae bacterium]